MIRILHCGDIHLDSHLGRNLSRDQADERRSELLDTWLRLMEFADEQQVNVVLITGDLFDQSEISETAENVVYESIRTRRDMLFFYLRGNHDAEVVLHAEREQPKNLCLFNSRWKKYRLPGNVVIAGIEQYGDPAGKNSNFCGELRLKGEDFNIVLLHGILTDGAVSADSREQIGKAEICGKNIDYLALGHLHHFVDGRLDDRGIFCNPGCLESRGFDECRLHGVRFLEIDENRHSIKTGFHDISKRHIWDISVSVTELENSVQMMERVRAALDILSGRPAEMQETDGLIMEELEGQLSVHGGRRLRKEDMVRIILTGDITEETEISTELIRKRLEEKQYRLLVEDRTQKKIDHSVFRHDRSLKGAFVRLVENDTELAETMKEAILCMGLKKLRE